MRIQIPSLLQSILPSRRHLRFAVLAGGLAMLTVASVACSGDDDDTSAAQTTGGVATATSTSTSPSATPTATASPVIGTLVPFDTPTPVPTIAGSTGAAQAVVEMADMVPCSGKTYYEEQVLPNQVHALTYKDVPEGTPILFPFKEGHLRTVDSRQGAMLVTYDVDNVGVFSVQAAGTESLQRTMNYVTQGQVIGHFGGTFGQEDTDVFQGYQMFAIVGKEELVQMGDQLFSGESLDPAIKGCLVLP